MYSTFSANFDTTIDASREKSATPITAPRPKRNQVARACDWCRLNRVRCDDKQPCHNCLNRGGSCSNTKPQEATSLPAANRELQRLRTEVKDLQDQIAKLKDGAEIQAQTGFATPPLSDAAHTSFDFAELSNTTEGWQGLQQTGQIHYGPLSSSYFVSRITRYLSQALNQPLEDAKLEACMARFNYVAPTHQPSRWDASPNSQADQPPDGNEEAEDLTRSQEEHFLNLLWQSFHCVYPILDEREFQQHYDSLWSNSTDGMSTRKPSALVDVLLAVCMQYSSTFFISGDNQQSDSESGWQTKNANLASRTYYQRAQKLLQSELENPTIMVVQSHIYSIVYLYNTSLLNTAHINLGATLRIAHALRLHIRPLDGTSPEQQELQRRIWWTLYRIDSQLSMALGRPPLIQLSHVSCGLPGDDREHARLSGTVLLTNNEDISWLSFHVQCTKLIYLVQGVQTALHRKCSQLLSGNKVKDLYDDPRLLESLAEFLGGEMTAIHNWVQNVPQSLCNARKGAGDPFSTNRDALNLSPYSPLWLQCQRLLLELHYHHLVISTLRPFMRYPPVSSSVTPRTDGYNISCLNHAMAITSILNQVLSETDLLRGWSPIFQYQWDAILCTLGFVLANPVCPPTPSARKSLQTAIRTLDLVSDHFLAAKNAAQVVRQVSCQADRLINNVQQGLTRRQVPRTSQPLSTRAQNPRPPSNQNSFVAPGQPGVRSNSLKRALPPTTLEMSSYQPMPNFEARMHLTEMMPIGSLPELSPSLGTTESLSMPSATSADMVTGTEAQWLHASAMIMDSWTTNT
ncbi:transcriptional regulator family: Fungal Specific TF [Penicillium psychrosexuale]|uniref:transcriptional regulator family: Fungal Specific TF n=1 Tax=Penicillium psychrosexuale TaxID=1002107 RepID=UPI0025458562|nr:transcriptional regulator family: Fungal Specific TF [Penicillium psychrosexuale]KAJ5783502.1 transcriptional regulator family: Fungal Specific TF [Penicillium psychrosexuale]